jgi:Type III flagellar switch regulator (C-ring) FliN C-term
LRGFVDSRVPVYCEGVLKAWARPVVCRGVLAVQIESIVHGQGTKS